MTTENTTYPTVEELQQLKGVSESQARIYAVLLNNRNTPLTITEIQTHIGTTDDMGRQLRRLRDYLHIDCYNKKYILTGTKNTIPTETTTKETNHTAISLKTRAKILAPAKCYQCGKTPKQHNIILVLNHITPLHQGGTNNENNLQPLCEDCNQGKKENEQN